MKRFLYGLALVLIVSVVVASGCTLQQRLDRVASDVSEIRGLTPKADVEYEFLSAEELRALILEDLEEEYPREEASIDQDLYVLLDLMEEGQDLYSILLDVYSEQVIGFYDYESGKMHVVSDNDRLSPMDRVVFSHEYAHALQDQHFDLSSLPLQDEENSDLSMAALSLIEGDASLVQASYMISRLSRAELDAVIRESEEAETGSLESAPPFVREGLLFPYLQGLSFVTALGGWEGINQAYADVPQSTEQIIHPEKYLERDEPQEITMPDLASALGLGWSQLDSDVLGELSMRIYLDTFVVEEMAAVAAAGWDGDRYVYLESEEGEKVLALRSTWDSDADAGEFFDAYVSFIEGKSGGAWESQLEEDTARQWGTDGLNVYLTRSGADALLIMAPNGDVTGKVLAEFPGFSK